MEGEILLQTLLKGNFKNVEDGLQDYLFAAVSAPCEQSENKLCIDDMWKKRSSYAMKFLHTYAAKLQEMTEPEVLNALDSIALCCQCLYRHPIELSEPLLLHNYIYNILYRAIKKDMVIPVKQLAELLITNMKDLAFKDNEKASNIIYGSYAAVWNLVAQHDQKTNPMNPEKMQTILKSAIGLILHCPKKYRHVKLQDKMTIVVNKLEGLLQRKGVNKEQVLSLTGDYMHSVVKTSTTNIRLILKADKAHHEQAMFLMLSVMELMLRHVEFAASHNRVVQSHVSVSLGLMSRMFTSKTITSAVSPALLSACKACVALLGSIIQMVNQSASTSSTSHLLIERIQEAKEAVNSYVSKCDHADHALLSEFMRLVGKVATSALRYLKTGNGLTYLTRLPDVMDDYQDNLLLLHDIVIQVCDHEHRLLSVKQDPEKVLEMRNRIVKTCTSKLNSHLLVLQNSDKEMNDCEDTLDRSRKDVEKLSALVYKYVVPGEKGFLDAEEHLYFGNLVYSFGRRCYHALRFENCITFMQICCGHITKYYQLTGQTQNNQWRKYEILSDAHRRLHQYKEALDVIADCLSVGPDQLADAVELWVKFKVEAFKWTDDKDILDRTLYDAVKISGKWLPQQLLQLELDAYRQKKSKHVEAQLTVLDKMLEYSESPLDTGHILTEKAQLLWTHGKLPNRKCVDTCDEAILTLEGAATEVNNKGTLYCDLACAYEWRYLIADIDPRGVKERLGKISKKDDADSRKGKTRGGGSQGNSRPTSPMQEKDESRLFQDCYTVLMETSAMKSADRALELWSEVVQYDLPVRCVQTALQNLHVLASVYRLSDKVIEEHKALAILSRLSTSAQKSEDVVQIKCAQKFYIKAQTQLITFYCKHRQPTLANGIIKETETWLEKCSKNVDQTSQEYIYFLLSKCEALLVDGQVDDGKKMLKTVKEERLVVFKERTKDSMLFEGHVSCLQARYESLPFERCEINARGKSAKTTDWLTDTQYECSNKPGDESPIQLYVKGARLISGVLCYHMGGEWLITNRYQDNNELKAELMNSLERWSLLDSTLRSMIAVGRAFILVGEAREAKCYLQQGLKITQSFCLPRRFSEFHLTLGQVDLMSGKYSDCQAHLNSTQYLLHSVIIPPSGTDKNNFMTNKSDDVAENSDVNRSHDNTEDFLQGHMINMSAELTGEMKEDDPIGSPAVALKRDVKRPGHWSHMTDCTCARCRDLTCVALDLKYFMLQAQCLIDQGEVAQGEKHWNALVEVSDDLLLQAEQTWSREILKDVQTSTKKKAARPHHEALMLELSLMQAEYKLTQKTDTVGSTRTALSPGSGMSVEYWLRQAEKLMGEVSSAELYPQKADFGYLDGVPSLPWPQQSSEIEELCEGIGRVKLAEFNILQPSAQVSTPLNTNRKPRVNQVKKVYRAKPMVGVKKESKTVTKPEVPSIYISDNSIVEVDPMDVSAEEPPMLLTSRRTKGARSTSRSTSMADVKLETPAAGSRRKRESGAKKCAEAVKISPCKPVTIYNDENSEPLAPRKTSRRAQSTTSTRNNKKSDNADTKTRNLSTNSKLKPPELFSPISRIVPSSTKRAKENTYGTPSKPQGLLSPGYSSTQRVRTPVSCSSKKGKLLRDLESDSENEAELLAPKKTGRVVRGKKQNATSTRATKSVSKSSTGQETLLIRKQEINSRIPKHVLHEVQNSPLLTTPIYTSKSGKIASSRTTKSTALKPKLTNPQKSPVAALFKQSLTTSLAMEVEQNEGIYDFVVSSPEELAKAKGRRGKTTSATTNPKVIAARSKLSLKARRVKSQTNEKGDDIENVRKNEDTNDINIYDFDDCVKCDKEEIVEPSSRSRGNGRKSRKSKSDSSEADQTIEKVTRRGTTRGRLTRATTAVTEETRTRDSEELSIMDCEYSGGDVTCYMDSSLVLPDAPISSDDSNTPGVLSTDDEEAQEADSVSWMDDPSECSSVFTTVCSEELPAELPALLVQYPGIERARASEGSFGSINLSPADVSLVHDDSVCDADLSSLNTTESSSTEYYAEPKASALNVSALIQDVDISSESEIEIPRGGSDEENKRPSKPRARVKRGSKTAAVHPDSPDTELPRMSGSLMKLSLSNDLIGSPDVVPSTPPSSKKGNLDRLREELQNVFALIRHHPPALTYRRVCHALAWINLHLEGDNIGSESDCAWESAFYLSEAQGVTFRHNTLCNINRKLRKLEKEKEKTMSDYRQQLVTQSRLLSFGKTVGHLHHLVEELPSDITFCQVCVMKRHEGDAGQMIVVRYEQRRTPVVVKLPGFATVSGQKILSQMEKIMKTNRETMSLTDKVEWWQQRRSADDDLRDLLNDIEHSWLRAWKGLLLGSPCSEEDRQCLRNATTELSSELNKLSNIQINQDKLQVLLGSSNHMGAEDLVKGVAEVMCLSLDSPSLTAAVKLFREKVDTLTVNLDLCDRFPTVLILDKVIQHLPWESIPLLRSRCVSRMPSLQFLHAHYKTLTTDPTSVYTNGVDTTSTYYILDPEDNLPLTYEKFHSWFSSEEGWEGISKSAPSNSDYMKAFTQNDLFIYCGHGSGNKFMGGDMLQTFRCRTVCLLIGCSSGKLDVHGRLEATGLVTNYLLAGSPCVVSCSWDVTDRDVDRFTQDLLQLWINKRESSALLQCLAQSRDVCRLPYLIGAAPVVYGLPVHSKS